MKCEKCLAPTNQKLCYECWCFENNAHPPRSERELLTEGIHLDRLREICAAERDGRCVVLPDCSKCVYQQNGNMSLACSNCIGEQKFDNDLFTREEAESALAKEGADHDNR